MTRLQISVSDELVTEIDRYASEIGISRNAMCAVILHNGVERHKEILNEIGSIGDLSIYENRLESKQQACNDLIQKDLRKE